MHTVIFVLCSLPFKIFSSLLCLAEICIICGTLLPACEASTNVFVCILLLLANLLKDLQVLRYYLQMKFN